MTIGVLSTIAPYLLPNALAAFGPIFPGVEILVAEDTTARLLKLVQGCEIDCALASRPIADERIVVRDLFTEELRLALPPGHPLTLRHKVSFGDLGKERFIVMKEGHCLLRTGVASSRISVFAVRSWRPFRPWCVAVWGFRSSRQRRP